VDRQWCVQGESRSSSPEQYQSQPEDAKSLISVGESKPPESVDPAVLAAWTLVCNQVMNLDEALNK